MKLKKYSKVTHLSGSPSVDECIKDALNIVEKTKQDIIFDFNGVEFTIPCYVFDLKMGSTEYLTGWYSCLYTVLSQYKIDLKKWAIN
jgi:hypothetical protein